MDGQAHTRKKKPPPPETIIRRRGDKCVKEVVKRGRPSQDVQPAHLELLERYQGAGTATHICKYLNISSHLFHKWLKEDERFAQAVLRARDQADDQVEDAFFKRAVGFEHEEVTWRTEDGGKDGPKLVNQKVTKVVPPDPGAALNWLKNRRPEKWRDNKVVEVNGHHAQLVEKFLKGEIV